MTTNVKEGDRVTLTGTVEKPGNVFTHIRFDGSVEMNIVRNEALAHAKIEPRQLKVGDWVTEEPHADPVSNRVTRPLFPGRGELVAIRGEQVSIWSPTQKCFYTAWLSDLTFSPDQSEPAA